MTKPAVYMFGRSTNAVDVDRFLRLVANHIRADVCKPYLLYDGHRSHTGQAIQSLISQYFTDLRNVPYSCEFNAIETVWSVAKHYFAKRLLLRREHINRADFEALVWKALMDVNRQTYRGLFVANRTYIRSVLKTAVVA